MDGRGRLVGPLSAGSAVALAPRFSPAYGRRETPAVAERLAGLLRLPARSHRGSVTIPGARRLPRHIGTFLTLGFFASVGLIGSIAGGQYETFRQEYGAPYDVLARMVGFSLDRIRISGLDQLDQREVLNAAGITPKNSLAFLNAGEIRERLEGVPLIASAEIRKLFPNELVINLVERKPYALWQRNGELFIIATDGTPMDVMRDPRFAKLPLVVGDEANARAGDFLALLAQSGALRPKIKAGMLVSGRRWSLKMKNGIEVRLPETGAAAALARLAKLDREQKILDKDVLAIDLRMPDRVVVRLTEEAAAARNEIMKKKPTRGSKSVDT